MQPARSAIRAALVFSMLLLFAMVPLVGAAEKVLNGSIQERWLDDHRLAYQLDGPDGPENWVMDARTGVASRLDTPSKAATLVPERVAASRGGGEEVEIVFRNALEVPVELFWLDPGSRRTSYGMLAAGARRGQHTYEGHAWIIVGPDGEDLTGFVAGPGSSMARIDDESIRAWSDLVREEEEKPPARSPEDRPRLKVEQHNLVLHAPGADPRTLTEDGQADSPWHARRGWHSPDRRWALAMRIDKAEEHLVHLIDVAPDDRVEPVLRSHQYNKPGDRIRHQRPAGFDLHTGERMDVDPALVPNPWSINRISWHPDGDRVRMLYNQRGHQVLRLVELDLRTGESRVLIEEQSPTFIDYSGKLFLHIMEDGDRAIWMSERSGYNHLELVDLETGDRTPLTEGPWVVRGVDEVDEDAGTVRLRCLGLDPDQDPYHVHHAIVDLDTREMRRLTDGDGTHDIEFSPDGSWYVDRWSRVDLPPVHELRRTSDGQLVAELARADATDLLEARDWSLPERFVAKGRDGETDIWGIIVRPRDFDPTRRYPVIEHIYAGPHGHFVPKSFNPRRRMSDFADLGAVVVQIDGMGTNWRSKAFHDVAWKNLGDSGFPDRIEWMKAAAADRNWIDLDHVGIYGGSAGGQSALRALLAHGDFYDVAVADCGCHDNRMDKIWWNELWMGWPIGDHYDEQSNVTNAHKLEGELMLVLGGLDRNVDPASTLQVVDALVKADKDFEFVLMPTAGHGAAGSPYGHRRSLDFFTRKLVERE
ncbi:MAG: prolyl oligopeptidase family serine peptidase [Phycisphaerales bacterium]|nr:prolyl oligopeptidase family serine peptidase [Phycisphaerales bacterium]